MAENGVIRFITCDGFFWFGAGLVMGPAVGRLVECVILWLKTA